VYRLRKLTGRPLFDGVVAVVLGLAVIATSAAKNSVDPFLVYRPRDAVWLALVPLCIVLLMFRRTMPVVVLIVEFIVVTGIWKAGYNAGVLPAVLLVVVYSTVAYAGRREAFVAGGTAAVSTAFLYLSNAPLFEGGEVVACVVAYASAMTVGSAYRTQGLLTEALARERIEATRAEVLDERLHVAREVHDIVAHSLGVIAVQAGVGAHLMDKDPEEARAALIRIAERSRSSLDELRTVLAGLRSNVQASEPDDESRLRPVPGINDLPELIRERTTPSFKPTLTTRGGFDDFPSGTGHAVFRIVQEALTNSVRHGRAATAAVNLERDKRGIRLSVRDSGISAGAQTVDPSGTGYGRIGMRERAAMVGGTLRAGAVSTGGFEVVAFLPAAGAIQAGSEPREASAHPS
jgi:signal transduction histidine kinase